MPDSITIQFTARYPLAKSLWRRWARTLILPMVVINLMLIALAVAIPLLHAHDLGHALIIGLIAMICLFCFDVIILLLVLLAARRTARWLHRELDELTRLIRNIDSGQFDAGNIELQIAETETLVKQLVRLDKHQKQIAEQVEQYQRTMADQIQEQTRELRQTNRRLERQINERRQAEEQLRYIAYYDPLTELPNRLFLMDRLNTALQVCHQDARAQFALLFVDLNRFKMLNDSMGHDAGDQLLVAVAKRMREAVDPDRLVARLAADEFAVLLENNAHEQVARQHAKRIQNALAKPIRIQGQIVYTSAAIGVAIGSDEYQKPADVLRDADNAMYQAKRRNLELAIFEQPMHQAAADRLKLEAELKDAIADNQLQMNYQPIYDLATGKPAGYEALVRWPHSERGMISPGKFIPLAEETGLIVDLGYWTLTQACRQVRQWNQQYQFDPPLWVSVNLSTHQFLQIDLADRVEQIMETEQINPAWLKLELTESAAMDESRASVEALLRLKMHGIRLMIDDFGTGHSSLHRLSQLPFDSVKIDRAFICDIDRTDHPEIPFLEAIVQLARSREMTVTVEGIEIQAQHQIIAELGCDFVQGFLHGKPATPQQAEKRINDQAFQPIAPAQISCQLHMPVKQRENESVTIYRRLFQTDNRAILIFDQQTGQVIDANPAACKLFNDSHTNLLLFNQQDLINRKPDHPLIVALGQETDRIHRQAFDLYRADGSRFHALCSVTRLGIADRQLIALAMRVINGRH